MSSFRVRRARLDDVEALHALEQRFPTDRISRASFRHLIRRAHADVLVCDGADGICGNAVVLYRRRSRTARLYSIVVDRNYQGRGLGSLLLDAAERAGARRGCGRLVLEVRPRNAAARALYRRRGYTEAAVFADFYEDGGAALRLEKALRHRR